MMCLGGNLLMSYSIIRVAKVKGKTNTTGIQKHVQRENKKYENADVDLSKSDMNYDLINPKPIDFNQKIDEKIEQNYKGKRKIRKDAVKHIDGVITSDSLFFLGKPDEDIKRFFEDSKEFLVEEYGEENVLYATVHMDEKTPHMHFGVVPITEDGRLSAKEILGNKKAMTEFQDRFNQYVNDKGYRLERGTPKHKTERKHQEVEQFKENTDYYQNQKDRARRLSDHYKKGEEEYKKKVAKLQKQHSILKNEVDMLEQEKLPNLKTQHLNMTNQIKEQKGQLDSTKTELQQAKDEKTKLNNDIESKRDEINNLKAFRDQIRDEKEKEEENYQSLKNVLYEPLNDDIEYEYKKPSLFSKESEKTGRVILKEDDYQILKKQSDFGKRMEPEYKKLINGETIQNLKETTKEQRGTINEQRHKMNVASKNFKKLREERDKYKTAYQEEKQNHENTKGFMKGICETGKHVFGAENYRKVINKIDDSLKPQYKQRFRNIVVLDHEDRKMFDNKDEKIRNQKAFENTRLNKQNKDKGFDLDL